MSQQLRKLILGSSLPIETGRTVQRQLGVLVILVVVVFAGCTSSPPPSAPSNVLRQRADRETNKARQAYHDGKWSSAAQRFERAAETYDLLDDPLAQATALHNQGQSLRQARQPEAAHRLFEQALSINTVIGQPADQAKNLVGLAQCHVMAEEHQQAIQLLEQALELAIQAGDTAIQAIIENDLGLVLLQSEPLAHRARILRLLESALVIHQKNKNSRSLATSHLNLGRAFVVFEEWEMAEEHLHHALEQFRAIDNVRGLALAHEAAGNLYLQLGQKEEARRAFRSARRKFAYLQDGEGLRRIDAVMP